MPGIHRKPSGDQEDPRPAAEGGGGCSETWRGQVFGLRREREEIEQSEHG